MEWHENIRDIPDTKLDEHMDIYQIRNEDRKRIRVRMIFRMQSKRFKCYFTYLVILTFVALIVLII